MVIDRLLLVSRDDPGHMVRPPSRCPNPDCDSSLGGTYEKAQFAKVDSDVWECRECGHVHELG